jgi:hypothetical protein
VMSSRHPSSASRGSSQRLALTLPFIGLFCYNLLVVAFSNP